MDTAHCPKGRRSPRKRPADPHSFGLPPARTARTSDDELDSIASPNYQSTAPASPCSRPLSPSFGDSFWLSPPPMIADAREARYIKRSRQISNVAAMESMKLCDLALYDGALPGEPPSPQTRPYPEFLTNRS